jgi:hypothetical protein
VPNFRGFEEISFVRGKIGVGGSLRSRSHKGGEDLNEGSRWTDVPALMITSPVRLSALT